MTTTIDAVQEDAAFRPYPLTIEIDCRDYAVALALSEINELPQWDPRRHECEALLFTALANAATAKADALRALPPQRL